MKCNVCQTINEDQANFCRTCGTALARADDPVGGSGGASRPSLSGPDPLWAATAGSGQPDPLWADTVPGSPPPATGSSAAARGPAGYGEPPLVRQAFTEPADPRPTIAAGLAARRRRERLLVGAFAIVAVVVIVVVAALAIGGDSEPTVSTGLAADSQLSDTTPTVAAPTATATAPIPTAQAPATVPTATAVTAATVAPAITTVAPPIATTAPSTTALIGPVVATVATVATTQPSSSTTANPTEGDLGLSMPISRPPCDGQYITLIGASVDTPGVAGRVDGLLAQYPGSKYLKTELVCSSLSARSADGNALYVVFFGPFTSAPDACAARARGTKDSYVKMLENTGEPSGAVKC